MSSESQEAPQDKQAAPGTPESLPVVSHEDRELDAILRDLNAKQRLFLNFLLEGHSTAVAHRMAGYEGSVQAAYILKWKLKKYLAPLADARGMSAEDLLLKMATLADMPLVRYDKQGNERTVSGITIDQLTKILALRKEILALDSQNKVPKTLTQINIDSRTYEAPMVAEAPRGETENP